MVWKNLKIGNWATKIMPLASAKEEYPQCDDKGNLLVRVSGHLEKGHFINEATGEKHETAFWLINGQPSAGFEITKEVGEGEYKEVGLEETEDLLEQKQYLVDNDNLLQTLKDSGKAIKFYFSTGKTANYTAYIYPSKLYPFSIMKIGTTNISEVITQVMDAKSQAKKLAEVSLVVGGISKTKVANLKPL